jgi:hypothetical protein
MWMFLAKGGVYSKIWWLGVVAKRRGCVACKKEKREAFYTLRPTPTPPLQPRPLNGESQFKDCNPTTSPHILSRDLSWSSSTSSLLYPRRHNQNPRRHGPSQRRHGPSQRALTSPLIGHIFAQDEITQIQGHRWVHKALIILGYPLTQKRLQIWSLSRILIHGAPLPFVPPRAYQTLG